MAAPASLADFEPLIPDSRVERLWGALRQEFPKLPEDFQLASYIQPRKLVPDKVTGELRMIPEQAIFVIVSANPHPRHKGEVLKSMARMSHRDWRSEEDEAFRFVGKGDPAMKFVRALAREHIRAYTNWSELN